MRYYFTTYFFVVFSGFIAPYPSHLPITFSARVSVRVRRAGFIEMIASLAALAKVCKKVTLLKKVI